MSTSIDFETEAIEKRPSYPPKPVGVAIQHNGQRRYLSFGHPQGNNSSFSEAARLVKEMMREPEPRFHNGIFDIDVAYTWMGVAPPQRFHDSLYLAFLLDPDADSLGLKPLAQKWLGLPPTERDRVRDWLLKNRPDLFKTKRDQNKWSQYISLAPGDVVGPYAMGDVKRTDQLVNKMLKEVRAADMLEAYEREVALTPITLEMERSGLRCDVKRLRRDLPVFEAELKATEELIYKRLRRRFNINSPVQLFEALHKAGKLNAIVRTENGNPSTSIKVLQETCNDPALLLDLSIHSTLENYIHTFIVPWIELGERLHPTFNQTRDRSQQGYGGTRTGRFSSSDPNFQNIPADVIGAKNEDVLIELAKRLKKRGLEFIGLRDYILPDDGCAFISADYSQQEPRILAHFEQGKLMQAYIENPKLDVHGFAKQLIEELKHREYPRKFVKVIGLGLIYGMGLEKLGHGLGTDANEARSMRDAYLTALPGIRELQRELKTLANKNEPLVTWGGRRYFCEPPKMVGDQVRTFEYKMLNTLIQGSAADCTKQGMLNVKQNISHGRIAVQVHDELVLCVPRESVKQEIPRIKEAMEAVEFRVPMVTDIKIGRKSWGRLE